MCIRDRVSTQSTWGIMSECGIRGGYVELNNWDSFALAQFAKLRTVGLCSNVLGQIATDLMVNPPKSGVNSPEVVALYEKEKKQILENLTKKAELVSREFPKVHRISCNPMHGALYVFPRVEMTQSAIAEAKKRNVEPDSFYCVELLKNTGIMVVPGNGFKQREGTYHFRMSNLVYHIEDLAEVIKSFDSFNKQFFNKFPQSDLIHSCLLYTSPSPRDLSTSRMPSSA
eukprot:TRINITY_DN15976_c0_g1_i1.p1 TRINITY_DN15976_c0_g1~~TRINITY_DN15976_c0_g1_i1.p1  ORF type:complete len:228 (+),score=39.27 TRINITY_DN15976_c0_g1_i1:177-860(+)